MMLGRTVGILRITTGNREEIQRLQVQAAALALDPKAQAPLAARVQMLEEANKRLSIAPLLEAGEFSTISENLTEADVDIREGRWADHIEKAVEKLPNWAATGAKNVLITKDTALFQGLNRMVQYSDFVAKAVLYDHLVEKKGKTKQEALDQIFDEFVAYNRLPGRGRDFLESMGLMWFWNYKLRIMKVMANTLRDRPLTALMLAGGVGPGTGIDTVWDGSLAGNAVDGSGAVVSSWSLLAPRHHADVARMIHSTPLFRFPEPAQPAGPSSMLGASNCISQAVEADH